jgi:hypothetical protein
MKQAKKAGFGVGLTEAVNQGFQSAPPAICNIPFPDDWGRRGNLGTSVCPGKPSGQAYLVNFWSRLLDEYQDPGLDFLVFWPYDEGGCGCAECWPWGAKGFLHLSNSVSDLTQIDNLLAQTDGPLQGRELRKCVDELIAIYHAESVHTNEVAPPEMESKQ